MAVTVKPDWESGATSADGAELVYNVHGAADDFEAWAGIRDFSPTLYLGFFRGNFTVARDGPNLYKGRVPYRQLGSGGSQTPVGVTPPTPAAAPSGSPASDTDPLDGSYTFQIRAKNVHVRQSLRTKFARLPGDPLMQGGSPFFGNAETYARAIGVDRTAAGQVSVAGTDVFEPEFTWTRDVDRTLLTTAYLKILRDIVGQKKNDAVFYQYEGGTTILSGVSGRQLRGFDYALSFTFVTRRNITNKIIVPGTTDPEDPEDPTALVIPFAAGWDHIWFRYEDVVMPGEIAPRAKAAYVEEVIADHDFNDLRL